jgi:AcrR family transcriptional regulator
MSEPGEFKTLDRTLRKQRVIDTATNVFHEKGFGAATLDDVARELGLTKSALYHYVSSKEELLSVIYIRALESFFARAYEIGASELAPPEKMRALIRHHIKHIIVENLPMFAVFFSEENQLPEADFQKIRTEKRKYTRIVEEILEAGVAQGCFRRSDAKLQAFGIIGMCNWLYKWFKSRDGAKGPDDIADCFLDLLEHGYLAGSDRTATGKGGSPDGREAGAMPTRKRELLEEIRGQSEKLARLVDELESLA